MRFEKDVDSWNGMIDIYVVDLLKIQRMELLSKVRTNLLTVALSKTLPLNTFTCCNIPIANSSSNSYINSGITKIRAVHHSFQTPLVAIFTTRPIPCDRISSRDSFTM